MITRISREITDNRYIGVQHPPADKVIGGEMPYLSGTSAGRYVVPDNTKLSLKCLSLSVRPGLVGQASRSVELAGIVNCGVASYYIGATKMTENRIHEYMIPNLSAADEVVVPFYNAFQTPGIGEGVICPSGTTFYIKVTPAQNSNIIWECTVFGRKNGVADIQKNIKLTATTTADQIILQYTPDSDFTILAVYVDAEAIGQLCGQGRIDIDGRQVTVTPYLGMGESTSNMFDLDSYAGIGTGAYNIPLWGIDLYPGENIDFIPIPYVADQSVWGLTIAGNESALSTGGTTGATSFAY